jgi:hypothetical protein
MQDNAATNSVPNPRIQDAQPWLRRHIAALQRAAMPHALTPMSVMFTSAVEFAVFVY